MGKSAFKYTPKSALLSLYNDKEKRFDNLLSKESLRPMYNFERVSIPPEIPLAASRTGMYSVREGRRRIEYHRLPNGVWFQDMSEIKYSSWEVIKWNLFPSLPDTEYVDMYKVFDKLDPRWQRNTAAYFNKKENRINRLESRLINRKYGLK